MHCTKCMLPETGLVVCARTRVSTPYVSVSEWCPDGEHGWCWLEMGGENIWVRGWGVYRMVCCGEIFQTYAEMLNV